MDVLQTDRFHTLKEEYGSKAAAPDLVLDVARIFP